MMHMVKKLGVKRLFTCFMAAVRRLLPFRLLYAEVKKVWQSRFFGIALAALLAVNIFLLWVFTSPMTGAFSSNAYKTMQNNLQGLSMSEKQSFVSEELRRTMALLSVDNVLRMEAYDNGRKNEYYREMYKAELEEFYDTYRAGGFLEYNTTLANEYKFLKKIQAECETVAGYETFLDEVQKKAVQLSGISIFAESTDGYAIKNIEKTAKAYENIRGVEIDYFPQMGVFTALDFELTDLITVFAMLLTATVLVRTERDNGLLKLVRTAPGGRLKTALAKLFALCISMGVILILLYGVNLLYCSAVYGLGDLSRSIQSVPALMRSTLKLSVKEYLGLFLLTKWAACVVAGVFAMLCMLLAKRAFWGYFSALCFFGVNLLLRFAVAATSNYNVLKYANLVSLLRTNELIGSYRNLYFFTQPVSIWAVEGITAFICLAIFTAVFCIVFCKAGLLSAQKFNLKLPQLFKRKTCATTLARQELKKLFFMNGAALFLIVFTGYQIYSAVTTQNYLNADEIYYSYYIKQVQGEITEKKIDKLKELYIEFEPIISIQSAYAKGEITAENMSILLCAYSSLQQKMNAFNRVWYSREYLYQNPRAQFVYESGWLNLFDVKTGGAHNRLDALFAALLSAVCFSGLFAMEKQSGMERVIASAPLGRTETVNAKLRCTSVLCAALTAVSCLPPIFTSARDYGLGAFTAPSYSIMQLSGMWELPLFFYIIMFIAARYIAFRAMAGVTLFLSHKTGNMFGALFISSGLFALPLMLSLSGLENAKWLGIFPLFNAAAMLTKKGEAAALILLLIIFSAVIYITNYYLYNNFGKSKH